LVSQTLIEGAVRYYPINPIFLPSSAGGKSEHLQEGLQSSTGSQWRDNNVKELIKEAALFRFITAQWSWETTNKI